MAELTGFQNQDLRKLAEQGYDFDAEMSYVEEIRDKLQLFFLPPGNARVETFNITNAATFGAELQAWFRDPANADIIVYSQQFLKDATGTPFYMIIYV